MKWFTLTPCQKKHTLLSAYLAALRVHDRHLRERSEVMSVEKDLLALKQLTQASRVACRTARHRYLAHVREHGC